MVYIANIKLTSGTIVMAVDSFNRKDAATAITALFPDNKRIELYQLKDFLKNGISVDSRGRPSGKDITTKAQHVLNR